MMKFIFYLLLIVLSFFMGRCMAAVPVEREIHEIMESVRGFEGLQGFAFALIFVQGLFLIFRAHLGVFLGFYRLLFVAVLSVVATILVNIVSGKSIVQSVFLDASTLLAYQVLLHQIKKQWEKRGEDVDY